MNNKKLNRHIAAPEADLQIVYEQIHRNKEDIELFYAKNKMKFPPIMQSKNIVFMHLIPEYADIAIDSQGKKISRQQDKSLKKLGSKEQIQKHPSICNIEFFKPHRKKNRYANHHRAASNQFTPNTNKTLSRTPKNYYLSQQKSLDLKFLNEPSPQNKTIQNFFEKFNKNKSNDKKNTLVLTKSFEITKESKKKHTEPLSINQISTQNPQVILLDTLQGKTAPFNREGKIHKSKLLNKTPYENAKEENNIFRRRQVSYRKQAGYFQPWHQETILQDDCFSDLRR